LPRGRRWFQGLRSSSGEAGMAASAFVCAQSLLCIADNLVMHQQCCLWPVACVGWLPATVCCRSVTQPATYMVAAHSYVRQQLLL
jgi:hypothetical protein